MHSPSKKSILRKISLTDISKCHPKQPKSSKNRCLPTEVYTDLQKSYGNDIYQGTGCKEGEDHCLLDKSSLADDVKKNLRKEYLRPKRPKEWNDKPDTWLDNFNIMHVFQQYEEAYPWFKFLGTFPIDFSAPNPYKKNTVECLHPELCTLNLKKEYEKGVRGIGIVFNLDPHFKGGSHWVALYINLQNIKEPFVGYFDSYGYKTPALIARLMRSFKLQIKTCQLGSNARRFQYSNTECGMFSIYFIICMIHGISFKDFCKDSVEDAMMLDLRKILFSK
jgi:hypothetical protein